MIYTGVGARKTPLVFQEMLSDYAEALAKAGYLGRSGGADGADTAIEEGIDRVSGKKEIYLPWRGFNHNKSSLFGVTDAALQIAATVHPAWGSLEQSDKKLHGRNVYQVLGANLSAPSRFLLCWTADGLELEKDRTRKSGGTATAIVLALRNNIPVFNLGRPGSLTRLNAFLTRLGVAIPDHSENPIPQQAGLF
jgi:hypothetical protein